MDRRGTCLGGIFIALSLIPRIQAASATRQNPEGRQERSIRSKRSAVVVEVDPQDANSNTEIDLAIERDPETDVAAPLSSREDEATLANSPDKRSDTIGGFFERKSRTHPSSSAASRIKAYQDALAMRDELLSGVKSEESGVTPRSGSLRYAVLGVVKRLADSAARAFLPQNDRRISAMSEPRGGISQAQFDEVLSVVREIYAPIVARHGGRLMIESDWANDALNAESDRSGSDWTVRVFGGLARHSAMTQDAFALIVCHELGHQLGGFPRFPDWSASGGQADYYAASKCARHLFADARTQSFSRSPEDAEAVRACAAAWPQAADRRICERTAFAGLSLGSLIAEIEGSAAPSLLTPDPRQVDVTERNHPTAQCRVDTFLQGALCAKPSGEEFSPTEPNAGACTASQGFMSGLRPRCWYKPPDEPA